MGGWSFEGPNPVVSCQCTLELTQPLSPVALERIGGVHPRLIRDLPRKLEMRSFGPQFPGAVQIGPFGIHGTGGAFQPAGGGQQAPLAAVVMDVVSPAGVTVKALRASANQIGFQVVSYPRWAEFWPLAERVLSTCLGAVEEAGGGNTVGGIVLEYEDVFTWKPAGESPQLRDLLREKTDFVPRQVRESTGPTHSFCGWVTAITEPIAGQRVDNLNLTVSVVGEETKAAIAISQRIVFAEPVMASAAFGDTKLLEKLSAHAHDRNKDLLKELLSDQMIAAIDGLSQDHA